MLVTFILALAVGHFCAVAQDQASATSSDNGYDACRNFGKISDSQNSFVAACDCLHSGKEKNLNCSFDIEAGECRSHTKVCAEFFSQLYETKNNFFCSLNNAHYSIKGHFCFTKFGYIDPITFQFLSPCGTPGIGVERGHGIDFNGPQNTYKLEDNTTFIYEEGSIKKLTDKANPMKQAFRIPDDFLIPGKTVGLIESGWHDDATNNVLQTWFVGKGHPGECLSIPLNLEKFSLKNGEYYLVSIIPDDKLKQETGQREFDIKLNGVLIASKLRPKILVGEIRDEKNLDYDEYDEHTSGGRNSGGLKIVTRFTIENDRALVFGTTQVVPEIDGDFYLQSCNGMNSCGKRREKTNYHFIAAGFYIFTANHDVH